MKKKISKFYSSFIDFVKYNRQFCSYVVLSFLCTLYIRIYTTGSIWISASVIDLASILIIGSFGFFYKPQKQFNYYFVMLLLIDVVCIVNAVYYDFYANGYEYIFMMTALNDNAYDAAQKLLDSMMQTVSIWQVGLWWKSPFAARQPLTLTARSSVATALRSWCFMA